MGIDDGPADRQPHPHSAGLRCVEGLESALDMPGIDARPGIATRDEDAIRLRLLGADQQLSRPRLDRPHCFDCVQHQIQDDLLQLNTIPFYGDNPSARRAWTRTSFLVIALRPNTITSSIALLTSKRAVRRGAFLM